MTTNTKAPVIRIVTGQPTAFVNTATTPLHSQGGPMVSISTQGVSPNIPGGLVVQQHQVNGILVQTSVKNHK